MVVGVVGGGWGCGGQQPALTQYLCNFLKLQNVFTLDCPTTRLTTQPEIMMELKPGYQDLETVPPLNTSTHSRSVIIINFLELIGNVLKFKNRLKHS